MIISYKKGRGNKIHLYLDDEYQITTTAEFWADHFIADGSEIDEEEWQALVDGIHYRKALNKCFDLLSRRDYSAFELRRKLLAIVDDEVADRAIERMKELRYLDDENYARMLLRHLVENKKMSTSFICQEMRKRGIAPNIIEDVMAETEIDNVASIERLIAAKYRAKLQAENGREKVIAALARRGFSYGDIKQALNNFEEENDEF